MTRAGTGRQTSAVVALELTLRPDLLARARTRAESAGISLAQLVGESVEVFLAERDCRHAGALVADSEPDDDEAAEA